MANKMFRKFIDLNSSVINRFSIFCQTVTGKLSNILAISHYLKSLAVIYVKWQGLVKSGGGSVEQ